MLNTGKQVRLEKPNELIKAMHNPESKNFYYHNLLGSRYKTKNTNPTK